MAIDDDAFGTGAEHGFDLNDLKEEVGSVSDEPPYDYSRLRSDFNEETDAGYYWARYTGKR